MPDSNFPVDEAQIVALFVECILYGIYLVTFGLCIRASLFTDSSRITLKRSNKINKPMVVASIIIFVFASLDVAFGLRHNLDAFIYQNGSGDAKEHFSKLNDWVNIMKAVDYVMQTAIADSVLIYRCYMVFNKRWKAVLFPLILWAAGTTCGVFIIWIEVTTKADALITSNRMAPWVWAGTILNVALNMLLTCAIVGKVWSVEKRLSSICVMSNRSTLSHSIRVVVDSGLLYTISVIVTFCSAVTKSNANYATSDAVVQIIGIASNLIIIRIHSTCDTEMDG